MVSNNDYYKNGKLFLVGNSGIEHIGTHFLNAAKELTISTKFSDTREAFSGPFIVSKINWWLRGHRPIRLSKFGDDVVAACNEFQPHWLVATGVAPLEMNTLKKIKKIGTLCCNYLTDDPWSPAHHAPWFMESLPSYDHVFSPRRANIEDLGRLGCKRITYLPFAYAPNLHFPEKSQNDNEKRKAECDVVFIGGADRQRAAIINALVHAGINVHLYGSYWDRYTRLKENFLGYADPHTVRVAVTNARLNLGLVRKSNRDGHSMRTFETPAIGACMLLEDTQEHREIFGEEGRLVCYFSTVSELIKKSQWLLLNEKERMRLRDASYSFIIKEKHTYKDRLMTMLDAFR